MRLDKKVLANKNKVDKSEVNNYEVKNLKIISFITLVL